MSIDTTELTIMKIPPYIFCAEVGLVVSFGFYCFLLLSKKIYGAIHVKILPLSLVGAGILARLFGCMSGMYRALGVGEPITYATIRETGIVFYGGLLGLLLCHSLLLHVSTASPKKRGGMDVLAVCIPLFHTFTRIGCFLAGCCYGKEWDAFPAISYTTLIDGVANTADRIPVQLLEALFNVGLFIYLFAMIRRDDWREKKIWLRYLLLYSIGRFFLEYLRGDAVRGVWLGVSFSQGISIIICMVALIVTIVKIKKKTCYKETS